LISAVLGTDSETLREDSTLALLNYGGANFRMWTPVRKGQVMAQPTVKDQASLHPTVTAAAGFARILPRSAPLRVHVSVPRQLVGPLPAQSVVGTATVTDGRRVLARIPLVLTRPGPALSGLTKATRFVTRPVALAVIAAAAAGSALLLRNVRRRRRIGRRGRELEATGASP